jgi:arylsulfatase B
MTAFYDAWWAELEPTFAQTTEIHLGHSENPVVSLTGHDWIQEALPPWNQQHIRLAAGYGAGRRPAGRTGLSKHRGHWAVKVLTPGRYEISVRRWPVEVDQPITAALPPEADVPGASKAYRAHAGVPIPAVRAVLRLDGRETESKPVQAGDHQISFSTELTAGSHQLAPLFVDAEGNEVGAYYAVITRVLDQHRLP